MSKSELNERRERDLLERVATRLDVSTHQLEELDWTLDENVGNDGTVYGYIISFEPSDSSACQEMIDRITDRRGWVQIGPDL